MKLLKSFEHLFGFPAQNDADNYWQAEREYWVSRLKQTMQIRYELGLHEIQDDDTSTPPLALVEQIQSAEKANPDVFIASGCRTALSYLDELHDHGFDPRRFSRILEFGVGLGRLIRHFYPFSAELIGCDVTPTVVQYTQKSLGSRLECQLNSLSPPLPFPDEHYDFIYANSVFTHIQMPLVRDWISEFNRLITPGGCAIVSVFEPKEYMKFLSERDLDKIEQGDGYFEWGEDVVRARYAYMTEPRLRREWGQYFEVLELRPHYRDQSHLILKKR